MTDNELNIIRQNIACPQFGDDHYGAWGALRLDQRRAIKKMVDTITSQKAEIDRLEDTLDATITGQETLQRYMATAKTEAIKEFAEELKTFSDDVQLSKPAEICFSKLDVVGMTDYIVKEMVGDDK